MRPDRDPQPLDAAGAPLAPAVASREEDLLNAWDRLLAIAALYPAQNTRFHEAAAQWRAALSPLARGDGSICIEIGREERLAHEGVVQERERVARSRLYPLLTGIGVEHMLLSLDIEAEALHQLIAILRETRQGAERAIGFRHAELPPLPAGVTVKLRSFGGPGEASLGASPTSASEGGAPPGLRAAGEEKAEVRNPHVGVQSDLARSLEDKLTAQAATLYHGLTDGMLPDTLPAAPAGEAQEDTRGAAAPAAPPAPPFDALQLCDRLAAMEADAAIDTHLLGPSQTEWFAFLVQLAIAETQEASTLSARTELATSLERDLSLQEIQILVAACEDLLAAGDAERVDALLPLLLEPLAGRPPQLEAVLAALVQGAQVERRELLWPHLADAFLRERVMPGLAQTQGADGEPALALPAELRPRVLARLEALPALQTGRLAPAIFRPLRAELRPLLLVLLHSTRGNAVGSQLRAALLDSPLPAPPFAGLLALLGDYKPSQREFFRLLLDADEVAAAPALGQEAAALALQVLPRLPRGERRRPEVGEALLALANAPPGEADALLAAVLGERRLLLLPAWPAAARRQARRLQRDRLRVRRRAGAREELPA